MINNINKNKINLFSNLKNQQGGFTLVEALTAIFILTFVVVGLMTVVSDSLFATKYARDEITANYLLQEAIDYVRNDRDTNVFLSTSGIEQSWTNFYQRYANAGCDGEYGCALDVNEEDGNLTACSSAGCSYLYLKEVLSTDDKYFYSTSNSLPTTSKVKTNFRRTLKVTSDVDGQIQVVVKVTWKNGNIPRTRELTTTLSRWQ